jgi:UDP-N-acetylglucosamine 2-epimerase (non-hydrolysing)
MPLIDLIAGARPNFMKIAPIIDALEAVGGRKLSKAECQAQCATIQYRLIHTGQHYDQKMSAGFFQQLGLPEPDINLEVGSGTQAEQTAAIMTRYEKVLMEKRSELCLVVGDVTSTMACAIVAKKMWIRVAHVEGGIRSGDVTMPEEINRIVTDSITDYFFTTSDTANQNLRNAGVTDDRIFFVGNTMIDTLLKHMSVLRPPDFWQQEGLRDQGYFVLTLHRPNNVDDPTQLHSLLEAVTEGTRGMPVVFPVHPRTRKQLESTVDCRPSTGGYPSSGPKPLNPEPSLLTTDHQPQTTDNSPFSTLHSPLKCVDPQGYLEFNYLVKHAKAVITDSGGITEESTVMGVPCLTLRDHTERPETVTMGTNELVGTNPKNLKPALDRLFEGRWKRGSIPPLWDGQAANRIVNHLQALLVTHSNQARDKKQTAENKK